MRPRLAIHGVLAAAVSQRSGDTPACLLRDEESWTVDRRSTAAAPMFPHGASSACASDTGTATPQAFHPAST